MSNVQSLLPVRRAHLLSFHGLGRVALACALVVLSSSACTHNKLHASFGARHQAVMAAQSNAHPAHDPVMRGDEAKAVMQSYYGALQGQENAGGGSTGGGAAVNTAGVPPLR